MKLKFKIKPFNELYASELYQLLQLRSEVFVVEQNCVYQDIDGKDEIALHVLAEIVNQVPFCPLRRREPVGEVQHHTREEARFKGPEQKPQHIE